MFGVLTQIQSASAEQISHSRRDPFIFSSPCIRYYSKPTTRRRVRDFGSSISYFQLQTGIISITAHMEVACKAEEAHDEVGAAGFLSVDVQSHPDGGKYYGGDTLTVIKATAPGRCGIVGNPTDMYGGSVISCTTAERAECVLTETGRPFQLINGDEEAMVHTVEDLKLRGDKLDIARAVLQFFELDASAGGFRLELSTQIPMRAGVSGSTAMIATLVGALYRLLHVEASPYTIAETMRKIEARIMGVTCGFQDQHMAVFGGLNYMDFAGKEMLQQRDDEPLATVEPLAALVGQVPLLLAHTGIQHHSGTVHKTPRERWLAGEGLVRAHYTRIAELARAGKRALLRRDWNRLGALMNENHQLVAELGGSGPANDRLIEAARAAGAYGAKLAGAGGGGTILALTADPAGVGKALMDAGAERLLTPIPSPGLTVTIECEERR